MKRLIICAGLVAALATPAIAVAGPVFPPDNDYQGRIEGDPNTYFGFDAHLVHGKKTITNLNMAIPMNCYSDDRGIAEAVVRGSFKVRHFFPKGFPKPFRHIRGFFAVRQVDSEAGSGRANLFAFLGKHGRMSGDVSVRTHSDSLGRCYSGDLGWAVKRGAHVTLPPPAP